MIIDVRNPQDLKRFTDFPAVLYQGDPHYVPPILASEAKELRREVLEKQAYTALLSVEDETVRGRLLFTFRWSKKRAINVAYFSFFECQEDIEIARELFEELEKRMAEKQITYAEGPYCPFDPDNRRGILVGPFDDDPYIFLSYNKPYYPAFLEAIGFSKKFDTLTMSMVPREETTQIIHDLGAKFQAQHPDMVRVDSLDWKNLDRDVEDIHHIMDVATTEINYQNAPSREEIMKMAQGIRLIADRHLIKIAREKATGEAVGFVFAMADFNQLLKKTGGRIRPLAFFFRIRRITRIRGIMQYIVPRYQATGLLGYLFQTAYDHMIHRGMTAFEAGTIMENNPKSWGVFLKFGGTRGKTFRFYGKEI